MVTLEKYYKLTSQQEYEKNPKLCVADVQDLLNWSNENIKLHGKLIGESYTLQLLNYTKISRKMPDFNRLILNSKKKLLIYNNCLF